MHQYQPEMDSVPIIYMKILHLLLRGRHWSDRRRERRRLHEDRQGPALRYVILKTAACLQTIMLSCTQECLYEKE